MKKNRALESFHKGENFKAYEFFGCHKSEGGRTFRVWAPHAAKVTLAGSFNNFCGSEMARLKDGESFELTLKAKEGDRYRFEIFTRDGRKLLKADPYAFRTDIQNTYDSVVYKLKKPEFYDFSQKNSFNEPINIYEVNLLSWKRHKDNSYLSYKELERTLVPYVKNSGYTHVEFMPVTEFPYDGSWGYQTCGYFAPTSRLGTPLDFQNLVKAFHANGIKVILDWVPSHFPKDSFGLYEFDGEPLYESPVWDRMELPAWGTRRFDFGRGEVDSFLISGAHYLFEMFNIDGLRIDAVASMLYLDYDRAKNDFTPNVYGDNRNLEAIDFLKKLNTIIKRNFPAAITIAEESTAFEGVTKSVEDGGLGFDYKWNLGWMNDTLFYMRQDPYFRSYHHDKLTFSLVYAFSENYILPVSHDEVVHVKGSLLNKMFGEYADKFSGERQLLGYMFAHPGKKLGFMGYEIGQFDEWNYDSAIEYFLKKFELHKKMSVFVRDLNFFYKNHKQLYEIDNDYKGFEWLVVDDNYNNVIAFNRYSRNGESLTCICNFSGVDLLGYGIGADKGKYRVALNTDGKKYGGRGVLKKRVFRTREIASHGKQNTLFLDLPKLTCLYLIKDN